MCSCLLLQSVWTLSEASLRRTLETISGILTGKDEKCSTALAAIVDVSPRLLHSAAFLDVFVKWHIGEVVKFAVTRMLRWCFYIHTLMWHVSTFFYWQELACFPSAFDRKSMGMRARFISGAMLLSYSFVVFSAAPLPVGAYSHSVAEQEPLWEPRCGATNRGVKAPSLLP